LPKFSSDNELLGSLAPYFLDWLAHPSYDEYWKRIAIEEHYAVIRAASLTIAAWYDIFLGGSLRNYIGLKEHAADESARQGQQLLVTIGGHAGAAQKVGDVDFGPSAPFDEDAVTLDWYDHLFKNAANQFAGPKRVKIFVMGSNRWRDEDDWPLARARDTRYFLHSAGKANTASGDGLLSTNPPQSEDADQFTYDPGNPAPTIGGPLCCDSTHLQPGPRDQKEVEARQDVLVYSTPALTDDLEVTGPVHVELFAKSSTIDTDFTAKLVDVGSDGFAQNVTEGIVRGRYRNSQQTPEPMKPGEIYKFTIDLWSTSNVFRRGHRVRLEISSSNFPRFDRNTNTGDDSAHATRLVSAVNTITHDKEHPSALILPIVPKP
jgi:hypothetical protein